MKHYVKAALVAAGMALLSGQASAATLGLTTETPHLSSSMAVIDYVEFGFDGDLSTFGAEVDFTSGVSPSGATKIGFGIGFSLADPPIGATGGFDILDEDGLFLSGDLLALGFTEDTIELQFGNLSGSGVEYFGSSVLALISFDDSLGTDPFAVLPDGASLGASIMISNVSSSTVAPIPLPAGLPLLLTSIGGTILLRRRKAYAAEKHEFQHPFYRS